MATTEALIKYYDCLKDSFNKIQAKDNKTALVTAALRPKIREELIKSHDLLVSYLSYIQVFTTIYSDRFSNICYSVICPLFREHFVNDITDIEQHRRHEQAESNGNVAKSVHHTMKEILRAKPELVDEYIHCVIKLFPTCYSEEYDMFISYVENSLEICGYVRGEPLTNLLTKILDRVNPLTIKSQEPDSERKIADPHKCIATSYELIYRRLDNLEKRQLDNVAAAILASFSREFLRSENNDHLNHLILYICSLDDKLSTLFINLLWSTFTNTNRPVEERQASVIYAASFMSRAMYVDMDKVLSHLESTVLWCNEFQFENQTENPPFELSNESTELFYALVQSILYLITQRYRELYEKESIERLQSLNIDKILCDKLKPLDICDKDTEQRFREVATLYGISRLKPLDKSANGLKKRKTTQTPSKQLKWKMPFKESNQSVPQHVRHLYRIYYDHRNFTVFRE